MEKWQILDWTTERVPGTEFPLDFFLNVCLILITYCRYKIFKLCHIFEGTNHEIYCARHITHSWSWALPEKLPIVQLLKNFPAFYGSRRFITVFTRDLHWSLSWARSIQSIPSHPISLRSILILSTHLLLGLPSGLVPSGFPTNILSEWKITVL
jgi:hypothetical protein